MSSDHGWPQVPEEAQTSTPREVGFPFFFETHFIALRCYDYEFLIFMIVGVSLAFVSLFSKATSNSDSSTSKIALICRVWFLLQKTLFQTSGSERMIVLENSPKFAITPLVPTARLSLDSFRYCLSHSESLGVIPTLPSCARTRLRGETIQWARHGVDAAFFWPADFQFSIVAANPQGINAPILGDEVHGMYRHTCDMCLYVAAYNVFIYI